MARKQTQAQVIARIRGRFAQAQAALASRQDTRDEHYQLYRSYADPIQDEDGQDVTGRSNIFVPRTFSGIETIHTRMMNATFPGGPVFGAKPRNPDSVKQAEAMELVMGYQAEKTSFRSSASDVLKAGLIYEYGIGKIVWYQAKPRRVRKIVRDQHPDPVNAAYKIEVVDIKDVEIPAYKGPRVFSIDPDDFYPDPAATGAYFDEDRFVIHRLWEPLSTIMRKADLGIYDVRAANKLKRAASEEAEKPDVRRQSLVGQSADDNPNIDDKDPIIQILEYWTDDEIIVVPWLQDVLLREERNPYGFKPFAMWRDVTVPNEREGISEAEAMSGEQDALNAMTNMVIDQGKLNVVRPMAYDANLELDEADLDVSSGKTYVPIRGIAQGRTIRDYIWEFPTGELGVAGPELINMFKSDMQDVTGTYDNVRGQQAMGETATEASIRAQAASARFETKIKQFEYEFLRPIGRMWAELNQMFLDQEIVIRIEGDKGFDFRTITPEEIAGDFDIEVRGANIDSEVSPQQHRQDFTAMLKEILAGAPILAQIDPNALKAIDWVEVLRYGIKLFEPDRVDDFMVQQQQPPGVPQLLGPNGQPIGGPPQPPGAGGPMLSAVPPQGAVTGAPQAPGPTQAPAMGNPSPQALATLLALAQAAHNAQPGQGA